jgi:excisionase family DNA binding protein
MRESMLKNRGDRTPPAGRRWATKTETADYVKQSPRTLDQWRREGRLKAYRVGGHVLFDLDEVDAAITARPA